MEEIARAEGIPVISLSRALPSAVLALRRAAAACDVLHCHTGRAHSLGVLATLPRHQPLVVSRRVDFVWVMANSD